MTNPTALAAQYVRMSTDMQDLSPETQKAAIRDYAARNGLTLVRTYEDDGRSGVDLRHRPAMRQLVREVAQPDCSFAVILVYDVSRWGRFEDTDASAYYEYHCRLHGVDVVYVQEPFAPDRSLTSALLKNLKRVMAAEYSRELAVKTRAGQTWVLEHGYQMGALPCIGFRRAAFAKEGHFKRLLEPLERKPSPTDRVRWVLGPPEEIDLVKSIFHQYANTPVSMREIAETLRARGVVSARGAPLRLNTISCVLACEAFIGNFVWGRKNDRTGARRDSGDPHFHRACATLPAMVSQEVWDRVQWKRSHPRPRISREQALQSLAIALRERPTLRAWELTAHGCPSGSALKKQFGSVGMALLAAGRSEALNKLVGGRCRMEHIRLLKLFSIDLLWLLRESGVWCDTWQKTGTLLVAHCLRLWVRLIWRRSTRTSVRWYLNKSACKDCDQVLLVRMRDECSAQDFIVLAPDEYRRHASCFGLDELALGTRLQTGSELVSALRIAAAQLREAEPRAEVAVEQGQLLLGR